MTRKKRERAASRPSKKGCSRAEGSGEKFAEQFFADFARSWQEQNGREMLRQLSAEQPLAYFQAMVELTLVLHRGSGKLSDFERQRNRENVLLLLKDRKPCQNARHSTQNYFSKSRLFPELGRYAQRRI